MAKHRTRRSKSERLQQAQIPIRHRYQIDSKINKTFIFGFLSHTLIASYAIDIFSFQSISSHITHPSWWKGLSYVLFCLLSPLLHFQANLSTLKALGLTFPSHIKFRGALLYHIHPETHRPTAGDAWIPSCSRWWNFISEMLCINVDFQSETITKLQQNRALKIKNNPCHWLKHLEHVH